MSLHRHRWLLLALAPLALGNAGAIDVLQTRYDQSHSGNNPAEWILGAANVGTLQLVYSVAYSGTDGPPVYLQQVATPIGVRDVLFVTTVKGIAAIDAASGTPIWIQSMSPFEYSEGASPAIDPNRRFVYGPGSDGRVHKLAVGDGSEVLDANWPIQSSVKTGIEKASSPLAIATTPTGAHYLYSVTSSYNDNDDYQGHLTAIDLASGRSEIFNTMCSDMHIHFVAHGTPGVDDCAERGGGIWGRAGVTYDPATNRIYLTAGNGEFDADRGGHNWGDSVLALDPDGTGLDNDRPIDSYTPVEHAELALYDRDLGTTSPAVLPAAKGSVLPRLGVQLGKDGAVRLLDLSNLSGRGGPGYTGGELQKIALVPGGLGKSGRPQPAVWTDVHGDGSVWVFASAEGTLSGLQLVVANGQPWLESRWMRTGLTTTSSPIIANDVLYTTTPGPYNASIVALDPHSGDLLWTSPPIDRCCHSQGPLVVDGKLYLASGSTVVMFAAPAAATPAAQPALPGRKPAPTPVIGKARVF